MENNNIISLKSIHQVHEALQLEPPKHPLISVYDDASCHYAEGLEGSRFMSDMYFIAFKDKRSGSIGYGRNSYDFQAGTLVFIAPQQVLEVPAMEDMQNNLGWSMMFHPDLIRKSHLGKIINEYSFFSYESNEALHLSEEEHQHISAVVQQIKKEYSNNLDKHSQRLIISNLELLLNYCTRFYDRQFYTRTNLHKDNVTTFETALYQYIHSDKLQDLGFPSVSYFGELLNMSPNYLSDMLKKETGKSAKAYINDMIVDKAKTILLNNNSPVSQIAYQLGFEYPQSFTRLFKSHTGQSPSAYRTLN